MIVDRLDPALRQFAATRTDLSASVLGVVRDSLNQRRAEASRDVNTVGVDIENREARSIPVRIYRGGPAPAPAVIYCHSGAFVLGNPGGPQIRNLPDELPLKVPHRRSS